LSIKQVLQLVNGHFSCSKLATGHLLTSSSRLAHAKCLFNAQFGLQENSLNSWLC